MLPGVRAPPASASRVTLFALFAACAGTQPEPVQPTAAAPPASRAAPASSLASNSRLLPQRATFADVVDAARALDLAGAGQAEGDEGCLIELGTPARFAADVLVGARPLPDVPVELASSLEKAAGPAVVVTAWGASVGELPEVALNAFTTTTPASARVAAVSLFVTTQGVFVRGAAMPLRANPEALDVQTAAGLLAQVLEPAIVYVTAERRTPLDRVIEVLRSVPNRFEVALAVALPKGTRLPAPPARSSELLCPEGLPAPGDDEPEGSLEVRRCAR